MSCTIRIFIAIALLITSTFAEDPWTPSPLCPFPSENLTRTPYEGDCSKYWECYEGARYPMDCPNGLQYNEEKFRCDDPAIANCDPDATIVYPTYPHSTVTTVSTAPTEDPGPAPECPFPSDELVFYPVVNNCSQYWECYQGSRWLMNCPTGQYWNVYTNYCDYKANVDCDRNVTITTGSTTTPGSSTTASPTEPTQDPGPAPDCPDSSNELVFFPAVNNCAQYWECFQGNRWLMSCPSGTFWNVNINNCDDPAKVDCNRNVTVTTSASTTT